MRCVNSNGMARGVAVVKASIDVGELKEMDKAGMRGVRFNFLPRLVDATPHEVYLGVAKKIAPLGWHTVVYFEAPSLPTITPFLEGAADDHRARPHVDARCEEGRRSSRLPGLSEASRREQENLGEGDGARAHLGQRPAL